MHYISELSFQETKSSVQFKSKVPIAFRESVTYVKKVWFLGKVAFHMEISYFSRKKVGSRLLLLRMFTLIK